MKMKKKCEIVASKIHIYIRCTNSDYLEDYLVINKMDNLEVIKNFIIPFFKEGKNIRLKDIPNKPTNVYSSKKRKQEASVVLKGVQKSAKKRVIEKDIKEVVATTVIIPSMARSGKSPKKVASVYVISEAPLRKKSLRIEIEGEGEKESVYLIRKNKDADYSAQKEAIEPTFKVAQLLASVILDQSEKHQEAYVSKDQEVGGGVLEPAEVQAAEVMIGLKIVEDSNISKEVVPETAASGTMDSGETCINMNLLYEDDFDCTNLNHISPTPSHILSSNKSLKHTSLPINKPFDVQNQLTVFPASK